MLRIPFVAAAHPATVEVDLIVVVIAVLLLLLLLLLLVPVMHHNVPVVGVHITCDTTMYYVHKTSTPAMRYNTLLCVPCSCEIPPLVRPYIQSYVFR